MRFSNEVSPGGGQYGTSVGAYSASVGLQAEQIFGIFRNGFTATSTITAASFVRGNPVVLTAVSASNNGYDVVHPDTAGQAANEFFVGCVADYPDTTGSAKTGVWQPEDWGVVQVYGLCTNAVVANATVSQAAGVILVPTTGSRLVTIGGLVVPSGTGSADTGSARTGVAGLAVLYQTLATSSAAGTTAAKVWLRAM